MCAWFEPFYSLLDKLHLNKPVKNYHFVAQGKTAIKGVDDGEEFVIVDVSDPFFMLPFSNGRQDKETTLYASFSYSLLDLIYFCAPLSPSVNTFVRGV